MTLRTRWNLTRLWLKQRVLRPIDLPALFRALAVCLLVGTVALAFVVVYDQNQDQHRQDAAKIDDLTGQLADAKNERDAQQALNDCRSGLASSVSSATTEELLTIGRLVVALGNRDTQGFLDNLDDLTRAGERLASATSAREAFEDTQVCPS